MIWYILFCKILIKRLAVMLLCNYRLAIENMEKLLSIDISFQ